MSGLVDEWISGDFLGFYYRLRVRMLGGAYIEHPFSIYSAYIEHILKAGGKQVAGREE